MTTGLRIARSVNAAPHVTNDIVLPLDIITQSTAVLAKKGAGKTNLGVVLVEEIHAAGVPVVVVDPKGDWYGIRSGADGDPAGGLPLPVFGGLHGDVPLEASAGTYLAEIVRTKRLSCVLDVSEFSGAERRKFLTAFADRLYRIDSREPMLLMLEEAHEYIPQGVTGEDAKMVGVFERIVKLGRWKGIGIVMMTQRSASLNKNVLTQVDNLFMMRTGSPQDRAAVQSWISGHGEAREIIDSLPGLATGEFWLWQPERGEPLRARARMRRTYDAGATPKIGEKPRPPATLADVDLGEISAAMHETIERAKADDPKALRAEITRLQRELAAKPTAQPVEIEVVRDVVPAWVTPQLRVALDAVLTAHKTLSEVAERVNDVDAPAPSRVTKPRSVRALAPRESALMTPPLAPAADEARGSSSRTDRALSRTEQNVLAVLAQFPRPLSTKQLALRAGSSSKSSTYTTALGALRRDGLIDGRGELSITDAGRALIGPVTPMPTGRALLDWWIPKLSTAEGNLLRALVDAYPQSLASDELAAAAGYSITSSTFTSGVAALRQQELIWGTRDALHVDDAFGE